VRRLVLIVPANRRAGDLHGPSPIRASK